jgi:aerobic-type carbon monoxide dehydrogenase small subunit (CoxS/CutS family)
MSADRLAAVNWRVMDPPETPGSGFDAQLGRNTKSCQAPAGRATGKAVTTGESASGPVVDAVRDAWYRGNVVQRGYCEPGQTLAAVALLEADRSPDEVAIARWMNGNLCRCGTYPRIRDAIGRAAGRRPRAALRSRRPPSQSQRCSR